MDESRGSGDGTAVAEDALPVEGFASLVNAFDDPIYVLDETGRFRYVNDAFLGAFGYDRDRVLGSQPSLVKDETAVAAAEDHLARLLSSDGPESVTFEVAIRTADGERVPCEDHMTLLPYEEEFRGSAGVLRDISEYKRREQELERQRARLDRVVGVASHDLRNPVNVLVGRLEMAEERGDPEDFAACRRAVERIDHLVEDMLVLARDGHLEDERVPVDLSVLGTDCWRTVETDDGTLVTDDAPTVVCGETQARHLLENLFRNAVEHGAVESDPVTVHVGPLDDGFYVADDGRGIPPAERERVFEDGYSGGEGTGLGLSIVAEIAEANDWTITVTESSTGGARVEFTGVTLA